MTDLPEICVTRLKAVAAALRASEKDANVLPRLDDGDPLGFNMHTFCGDHDDLTGHNCATVACIAGWVVAMFGSRIRPPAPIDAEAAEVLDMNFNVEGKLQELFLPADSHGNYDATPSEAADAIDRFLASEKPWPGIAG